MATLSKEEYLKRYLSSDDTKQQKKKKKKKQQPKVAVVKPRMRILDDDIEVTSLVPSNVDNTLDEDIGDDNPTVADVIDERPEHVKQLEKYRQDSRWKVLQGDRTKQDKENRRKKQRVTSRHDSDSDHSPAPAQHRHRDSYQSPARNRTRHNSDSDQSPVTTQRRHDSDSDQSPVRTQTRHDSDSDQSPVRGQRRHDSDSDQSPVRTHRRHDSDSDQSPVRKSGHSRSRSHSRFIESSSKRNAQTHKKPIRKGSDSDSLDSDQSPVRRGKRKSSDSDQSPIRKQTRKQNDSEQSIVRRYKRQGSESDQSPVRRHKRKGSDSDHSPARRSNRQESDQSPVKKQKRKSRFESASPERSHSQRRDDRKENDSRNKSSDKMTKTLSGAKAGLSSAKMLREETESLKRKEKETFDKIGEDNLGRHAKTVFRDKSGKRRDFVREDAEESEKARKQAAKNRKYEEWGKGLAQSAQQERNVEAAAHEMSKPLARYHDDADRDEHLRAQQREGDPMAAFLSSKKKKGSGKKELPKYRGPEPPPNRFGLRPGYRWDGVDRSNGFEKKLFQSGTKRKALAEEAYKWSVEDM